jgi:hypothetical protein
VRIDYYTSVSPGTHYELVFGGKTFAHLLMYNNSHLTLFGGYVGNNLWFNDNSYGDIYSGSIGELRTTGNSRLNMTGGTTRSYVGIYDDSQATISGGNISGYMEITGNGVARLNGSDFKLGGQSLSLGALNIPQLVNQGLLQVFDYSTDYKNFQYKGILTGILSDGSSFNINLSFTHFTDSRGDAANLILIPEPATLSLLALGGLLLRRRK